MLTITPKATQKSLATLYALTGFALLTLLCVAILRPIEDPDFWWHLKTGDYILEHRSLPTEDLFAFTNPDRAEPRETLILRGYWVTQTIYSLAYKVADFRGIILLRIIFLGSLLLVFHSSFRANRIHPTLALSLTALSLIAFGSYFPLDRPQVWSFLFCALLFELLATIRKGGRPSLLLAPLMLLWANCHGGFLYGDAILCLFALGSLMQYRHDAGRAVRLTLWAAMGILCSLINPNHIEVFLAALSIGEQSVFLFIEEYKSTIVLFRQGEKTIILYWLLLAAYLVSSTFALKNSKTRCQDKLIIVFLAFSTFKYMRNTPFLTVSAIPSIAYCMDMLPLFRARNKTKGINRSTLYTGTINLAVTATLVFSIATLGKKDNFLQTKISTYYPKAGTDLLLKNNVGGKIFNDYDYGGYLIWKLFSSSQVFIDGRVIFPEVYDLYRAVAEASQRTIAGEPEYLHILKRYDVDIILHKVFMRRSGQLYPIFQHILNDQNWIPVHFDGRSFISVRNSEKHRTFIKRYQKNRLTFVEDILRVLDQSIKSNPADLRSHIAKAEMLTYLWRLDEAEAVLRQAEESAPENPIILKDLKIIEKKRHEAYRQT